MNHDIVLTKRCIFLSSGTKEQKNGRVLYCGIEKGRKNRYGFGGKSFFYVMIISRDSTPLRYKYCCDIFLADIRDEYYIIYIVCEYF